MAQWLEHLSSQSEDPWFNPKCTLLVSLLLVGALLASQEPAWHCHISPQLTRFLQSVLSPPLHLVLVA